MKSFSPLLLSFLFVVALPAHAQNASECPVGQLTPISSEGSADTKSTTTDNGTSWAKRSTVTDRTPAVSVSPTTEAETFVQGQIKKDGLHVVHFWAPWSSNSKNELGNGWAQLVANNPDVTFTFVTMGNDGEKATAVRNDYDLPDRVMVVTQPDFGPSDNESNRRQSFLSLPVTRVPSTWIFHNNGELAFAMNYGEMKMSTIQSLLDTTNAER